MPRENEARRDEADRASAGDRERCRTEQIERPSLEVAVGVPNVGKRAYEAEGCAERDAEDRKPAPGFRGTTTTGARRTRLRTSAIVMSAPTNVKLSCEIPTGPMTARPM